MFNPFALFYHLLLFMVRPFFIVPPGTGHNILDDDHPMGDTSASASAIPPVGFGVPQDNITMQARITQLEQELRDQSQSTPFVASPTPKEPKINSPAPFKGNKSLSEEFILKCDQVFAVCHRTYHNDDTKLAFVFNLLEGDAYQWIKPALLAKDKPSWITTWLSFRSEFLKTYSDSDVKETARHKLKILKQTTSASSFVTEFKRYSTYLDLTDESLRQTFFDGLRVDVQDRLLSPQRFDSFDDLVDAAIEWDNLLFNRRRAHKTPQVNIETPRRPFTSVTRAHLSATPSTTVTPSVTTGPWPMDVDAMQHKGPLTQAEKDFRRKNNLCMYCREPGHQVKDCRSKPSSQKLSAIEEQGNEEPQQ